jgi:hypothetical protein
VFFFLKFLLCRGQRCGGGSTRCHGASYQCPKASSQKISPEVMKNEEKSDTSADSSLHHDDDQQGIFSSESESDEDLIPPPPTKRKRSNPSVKSLGNTKSKVFFLFYGKKRNLTFIIDFYFIEKFKSQQGKFICHTKKKRKVISEEFFFERRILLWTST